jgi:two-component system, cell cycle response regulator
MISGKNLKELSKRIGKLPTLPGVAIKILQAMQREAPDIGVIAEVISADAPLSANVLRVVNSPFYGLANKITSVHHAMVYLGLNAVKNLALSFSLLRGFAPKRKGAFDYVQFSKDSLIGAIAAKTLAEKINRRHGENAFFLGLLQNIGVLILAESMPREYESVIADASLNGSPLHEAETRLLGINHMEVGEFVTESWGLPATVSVPIGYHHCAYRLVHPLNEIEQVTRILHLSSLYVEWFKCPDLDADYSEIEKYVHAYEFESHIDIPGVAAQVTEGVKSVFPVFDLQIDEKKHIEIIDAAQSELAELSGELLNQVHSQGRSIDLLKQQVGFDGLTQTFNHMRFLEILQQEISRAVRYRTALSIIMADADHFKSINDFFGHQAGDHVLKNISAQLKKQLRDSDHIARYGGEEFAVILPMTPLKDALFTAERLRKTIETQKIIYDGRSIAVTMSFGVASLEKHQDISIEGFIKMADDALYDAKNSGRNTCCPYKHHNPNQAPLLTVLVIDDEEVVLVTVTKMLERLGYDVLAAKSGLDVSSLLQTHPNKIDMVIMDMVMPDMNPEQMLNAIRDQHAEAKVLLSSGYSLNSAGNHQLLNRTDGFLQKPYRLAELSQVVHATLNN